MIVGLKDLLITLGARLFIILPSIGVQSCLAWWLGPQGRGSYQICWMYAAVLTVVFTFGMDAAGQYFVASKRLNVSQGFSATLLATTIGGIGAVLVGFLVQLLPLDLFKQATASAFAVAVFMVPLLIWSLSLQLGLTAVRSFAFRGIITITEALVRLGGTILLLTVLPLGVPGALAANGLAALTTVVAMLIHLRRQCGITWEQPDRAAIYGMAGYGLRYYPASLSVMANAHVGTVVLALVADTQEVGLFAAVVALMMHVTNIPDAVATVIHPRVASNPTGRPELTAMCARVVMILCGAIILTITALGTPLVRMLYGTEFLSVVPLLWILALGALVRSTTKVFVPFLNGTNHPGISSIGTISGAALNMILLIVLYPRWGLTGAAWAMTAGSILHGAIVLAAFRTLGKMGIGQTFMLNRGDLAVLANVYQGWRHSIKYDGRECDQGVVK